MLEGWRAAGEATPLVAGAWTRPLFVGGWEHSDNGTGERVFNLQTPSLFVDLRLPHAATSFAARHASLRTMSAAELRLFARRHVFAGYSRVAGDPPVCVRHHVVDWNYVDAPRPRPNKWRIEMHPGQDVWKEWGVAKDEHGQHVYMERWERLPLGRGPYFAMRRDAPPAGPDHEAVLVVCGGHFAYAESRARAGLAGRLPAAALRPGDNLVSVVDRLLAAPSTAATAAADRATAEALLGLRGCHGLVGGPAAEDAWRVTDAIHPWMEGTALLRPGDVTLLPAGTAALGKAAWDGATWTVYENSDPAHFRALFQGTPPAKL